jgi:hypothetical protein
MDVSFFCYSVGVKIRRSLCLVIIKTEDFIKPVSASRDPSRPSSSRVGRNKEIIPLINLKSPRARMRKASALQMQKESSELKKRI